MINISLVLFAVDLFVLLIIVVMNVNLGLTRVWINTLGIGDRLRVNQNLIRLKSLLMNQTKVHIKPLGF